MTRKQILVIFSVATVALAAVVSWAIVRTLPSAPRGTAERVAYRTPSSDPGESLPKLWDVPHFEYPDQDGRTIRKQDLEGHVWIADFIYTSCVTACPILTARMVLLQRTLANAGVRFVSFSVDPKHDTQEVLAQYKNKWNQGETRWSLLRPGTEELEELATGMKIAVEETDDPRDPILHSRLFFLVDRKGVVRGTYNSGDPQALSKLVRHVRRLAGRASPNVDKDATGSELYASLSCSACHSDPRLAPPLMGLLEKRRQFEEAEPLTADRTYLRQSLLSPGKKVVAGYLNLMPSYDDHLSEAQLKRLLDYVEGLAAKDNAAELDNSDATSEQPVATVTDPVCGMKVRATQDTPSASHRNQTFHFCSSVCRERFVAHPEEYASGAVP